MLELGNSKYKPQRRLQRPGARHGKALSMHPHSTTPTKTCRICGNTLPATREFFYSGKGYKDGLRSDCKDCFKKKSRKWRKENPERKAENNRAWNASRPELRKKANRAWREANPERVKELNRASYLRRLDKIRAYYAKSHKRIHAYYHKNRDRILQYGRKYRSENPERMQELNAAWHKANPVKRRVYTERRRTRKLNAEGSHSVSDIQTLYEKQAGKCFYCGKDVGDAYHVDHVVPLARGGSNSPDNLVIACPHCNLSKSDKLVSEWFQQAQLI